MSIMTSFVSLSRFSIRFVWTWFGNGSVEMKLMSKVCRFYIFYVHSLPGSRCKDSVTRSVEDAWPKRRHNLTKSVYNKAPPTIWNKTARISIHILNCHFQVWYSLKQIFQTESLLCGFLYFSLMNFFDTLLSRKLEADKKLIRLALENSQKHLQSRYLFDYKFFPGLRVCNKIYKWENVLVNTITIIKCYREIFDCSTHAFTNLCKWNHQISERNLKRGCEGGRQCWA